MYLYLFEMFNILYNYKFEFQFSFLSIDFGYFCIVAIQGLITFYYSIYPGYNIEKLLVVPTFFFNFYLRIIDLWYCIKIKDFDLAVSSDEGQRNWGCVTGEHTIILWHDLYLIHFYWLISQDAEKFSTNM